MTAFTRIFRVSAALALAWASSAAASPQFNTTVVDPDRADCAAIRVTSDEAQVAAAEETLAPGAGPLQVTAGANGGIWVAGSDAAAFGVRACKFAMGADETRAESALSAIRVQQEGDRITARGPASGRWLVYFIVTAPRGSTLNAETTNGPISIHGVDANITARAVNGPIGIKESRGKIEARTVNGPVSIQGASGDIRAGAENGPLSVTLQGNEWEGEGLEGETRNGPLTVRVPSDYRSGVLVQSDGRSPFSCSRCDEASRTWDDDSRRVTLGAGPERVRLRTTNGPVAVRR